MFERRLRILLLLLGLVAIIITGRLVELQIVHGEQYRRSAERALLLRPQQLPFIRGRILDRTEAVLVSDEPCWDLKIDFRVIEAEVGDDPSALRRAMRRWRRSHRSRAGDAENERLFRAEVTAMWQLMADAFARPASGATVPDLLRRAREVYDRVQRIHEAVAERRGFDSPVAEEREAHAIISGLNASERILACEVFRKYPWVRVEPAARRTFRGDATPLAHVLGRMGRVDARTVAEDPNSEDPFSSYAADELLGVSGVELAAEQRLRGRRGQITRDRDGGLAEPVIEAEDGKDVILTIHAELQRRLYVLLGRTVENIPASSGGAIVVLDVPTREVLALVSYPSYDPSRFDELYPLLRQDTDHLPLRFRAVANRYAPGSTVKPLVCAAGLMGGLITLDTREECTGYLLPDYPNRWRCWEVQGTGMRKAHGYVNVVEALIGSCNVFMYKLGDKLTVDGLCAAFDMVGIGRSSGVGLREETPGINPTPGWLMRHKNSPVHPGHARLFAVGQGELAMTPLQVANLMATYASGRFRPVTLLRADSPPPPEWILPVEPEQLAAIKEGIYGVVNDPSGTAYRDAHFVQSGYALCGKTGSATAHPWPTAYNIPYLDAEGHRHSTVVRAGTRRQAIADFTADHPRATLDPAEVEVADRWPHEPPPYGERHSHAWFGGYLQAVDAGRKPVWSKQPRIAFAILVEFGGSGGRTSGPLAKKVAKELLDLFGPELNVNATARADIDP
ncbi:MAG: penicillin-binding transpeptidase domain-containing protein [Phycisphaerae bacterium]